MKLHGMILSPFVQRVLIAARIKGVALEVVPVAGGGLQSAEFGAISPMRRIPVLEADDGWTIAESAAIVAYLDETQTGPSLLPDDPRERARARQLAGLVDTEVAAGLRHYVVQKLFRMCDEPAQLAYGTAQLALGLDAIERIRRADDVCAIGDRPTIADAALIPFFALAELVGEFTGTQVPVAGRPGLDAWWARARAEGLGARTWSEMHEGFVAMAKRLQATAETAA